MASEETVTLDPPHHPTKIAIQAFERELDIIKFEIKKSRRHWDLHQPEMWSRASHVTDEELVQNIIIEKDLVQVRSGFTSYGYILLGKIRLPAIHDAEGDGYVHVRLHDPPGNGVQDVRFHSIFTDEAKPDASGHHAYWRAVQNLDTPLEFFNE